MKKVADHGCKERLTGNKSEEWLGLDLCLALVETHSVTSTWCLSVGDINSLSLSSQQQSSVSLLLQCPPCTRHWLHTASMLETGMLMNVLVLLWCLCWTSMFTNRYQCMSAERLHKQASNTKNTHIGHAKWPHTHTSGWGGGSPCPVTPATWSPPFLC